MGLIAPNTRVLVAGGSGLIGSAFVRRFQKDSFDNILAPTHEELDLLDARALDGYLKKHQPEVIIGCAARVGGIIENRDHPAEMITENLGIQFNLITTAFKNQIKGMLYFGSSCMYPRECRQPMRESDLMTGKPEPTSLPYATAKYAGLQMCLAYNAQYGTNYIPFISNTAYGPFDDFELESSHVLPALIRKFHEAKQRGDAEVTLWGTGAPRREFIYSEDIVDAALYLSGGPFQELSLPVNIGVGQDFAISELADTVASVVGFEGRIAFDTSKPDGAPRKLLNNSKLLELGWSPKMDLKNGIKRTYNWYLESIEDNK